MISEVYGSDEQDWHDWHVVADSDLDTDESDDDSVHSSDQSLPYSSDSDISSSSSDDDSLSGLDSDMDYDSSVDGSNGWGHMGPVNPIHEGHNYPHGDTDVSSESSSSEPDDNE